MEQQTLFSLRPRHLRRRLRSLLRGESRESAGVWATTVQLRPDGIRAGDWETVISTDAAAIRGEDLTPESPGFADGGEGDGEIGAGQQVGGGAMGGGGHSR